MGEQVAKRPRIWVGPKGGSVAKRLRIWVGPKGGSVAKRPRRWVRRDSYMGGSQGWVSSKETSYMPRLRRRYIWVRQPRAIIKMTKAFIGK